MKVQFLSASAAFIVFIFFSNYTFAAQNQKECESRSQFTLNSTTLKAKGCFVELTNEFFSGKTRALKVLFTPEPITDDTRTDITDNDARTTKKNNHAYLVLFLDDSNTVWQVNLTTVVPGNTVMRTVAWKQDELKQFSSTLSYNGKHLHLKNKGIFKEPSLNLGWDISINAPVIDSISIKTK